MKIKDCEIGMSLINIGGTTSFTTGKEYEIRGIEDGDILFIDDDGLRHWIPGEFLKNFEQLSILSVGDSVTIETVRTITGFMKGVPIFDKPIMEEDFTMITKAVPEFKTYVFRGRSIDWENLCFDCLDDGLFAFLIESKDSPLAYVGTLKSRLVINPITHGEVPELPFKITTIKASEVPVWRESLAAYEAAMSEVKAKTHTTCTDHSRPDRNRSYKVTTFAV